MGTSPPRMRPLKPTVGRPLRSSVPTSRRSTRASASSCPPTGATSRGTPASGTSTTTVTGSTGTWPSGRQASTSASSAVASQPLAPTLCTLAHRPWRWRSLRPRGRPLLARPPHACPRRLPPGPPWRRRRWGSRSALFPAGAPYSPERAPPPPRSLPSARSSPCPGPTSIADRGTWASSPPCPAAGASAQRLRFRRRTVTPTLWWTCGALSRYRARRRPLPPAAPSGESLLLQCMSLGSPASNMGGASTIAPSILASVLALVR